MGLNKRLFPGAGGYQAVTPFQNNIAAGGYNSSSTYSGYMSADLNANLTGNVLFTTVCDGSNLYQFGNNGSSRSNNQVIMTMQGPVTTNGLSSADREQSYYNYTGSLKFYGSNDGTNWTELTTHNHGGGALSLTCTTITTSYTASTWSYYKVDITAGSRGTYGAINFITPSVVI